MVGYILGRRYVSCKLKLYNDLINYMSSIVYLPYINMYLPEMRRKQQKTEEMKRLVDSIDGPISSGYDEKQTVS